MPIGARRIRRAMLGVLARKRGIFRQQIRANIPQSDDYLEHLLRALYRDEKTYELGEAIMWVMNQYGLETLDQLVAVFLLLVRYPEFTAAYHGRSIIHAMEDLGMVVHWDFDCNCEGPK